ncbi:MAG TPA: hypothetical protein VD969_18155 [Symbiobacteriaceae bacterium]|nr:hypothetical protein [Symbiobacteriaceae bacterium]
MEEKSGSLRGDLIKWAREEQRLTMRWVADHGGPCLGYQSEVENKKKAEVRWDKLTPWIKALQVTEPFVRGHLPRYIDDAGACRGLAADVGTMIHEGADDWAALAFSERARQVLCLISRESRQLPRVVLAYVLGLELQSLDALMSGRLPFVPFQIKALGDLTTLPESFFSYGIRETAVAAETPAAYAPAVEAARRRGISPEALLQLIEGTGGRPAGHIA